MIDLHRGSEVDPEPCSDLGGLPEGGLPCGGGITIDSRRTACPEDPTKVRRRRDREAPRVRGADPEEAVDGGLGYVSRDAGVAG